MAICGVGKFNYNDSVFLRGKFMSTCYLTLRRLRLGGLSFEATRKIVHRTLFPK
jgi:hypothetical protein